MVLVPHPYLVEGRRELSGSARYYRGLTVLPAGERFNTACLVRNTLGPLLSCALAWQERQWRRTYPEAGNGLLWPLTILRELAGDPFLEDLPPLIYGLTEDERALLRSVAATGGGERARPQFTACPASPDWMT